MNKFENVILTICTVCAIVLTVMFVIVGIDIIKANKRNPYDVNGDGQVNALDLLKVQKYIIDQNLATTEGTGVISVVGVKGE